jgi:transcription elongation factor Elf1
MNTTQNREKNLSRKILCSFFGHKIITTRNVTNHFKEFKCSVCGLELTTDLKGHKTFLTPELKDINETLIRLYQKRNFSI